VSKHCVMTHSIASGRDPDHRRPCQLDVVHVQRTSTQPLAPHLLPDEGDGTPTGGGTLPIGVRRRFRTLDAVLPISLMYRFGSQRWLCVARTGQAGAPRGSSTSALSPACPRCPIGWSRRRSSGSSMTNSTHASAEAAVSTMSKSTWRLTATVSSTSRMGSGRGRHERAVVIPPEAFLSGSLPHRRQRQAQTSMGDQCF
jgi:hypothetical protein